MLAKQLGAFSLIATSELQRQALSGAYPTLCLEDGAAASLAVLTSMVRNASTMTRQAIKLTCGRILASSTLMMWSTFARSCLLQFV